MGSWHLRELSSHIRAPEMSTFYSLVFERERPIILLCLQPFLILVVRLDQLCIIVKSMVSKEGMKTATDSDFLRLLPVWLHCWVALF